MHRRPRPEPRLPLSCPIEPRIAVARATPAATRQMCDPRPIATNATHGAEQPVGRGTGHLPKRIGADKAVDIDTHQSVGKAVGGKMRDAFLHLTSSSSSPVRICSR